MILLRPIASMKLGPTHTSTMTRPDPSPATEEVTQEHTFVLREIRGRASVADRESTAVDDLARARNKLYREKSSKNTTDDFYASQLCVRSLPVAAFLKDAPPKWPLPITSINEDRLLRELGLTHTQRNDIEGLSSVSVRGGRGLTEAQLSSRAIARLAADPPSQVGRMQQRTARWLVRPFPLGLRFSGKNMSPLPCWLGGAQHVCLNFSDVDLAVLLHFALFSGSGGFVLKPSEMKPATREYQTSFTEISSMETRSPAEHRSSAWDFVRKKALSSDRLSGPSALSQSSEDGTEAGTLESGRMGYWPPPQDWLQRTTFDILSIHNLPKRGEQRPKFNGKRVACHQYHAELSGKAVPPDNRDPSAPALSFSVHPIGGFCAISNKLPLPPNIETDMMLPPSDNGLIASFGDKIHCVCAEPQAVFFRVSVVDGGQEVAYETAILGRLRGGFRVFQLRGVLGTRIELCFLLVRVSFGTLFNNWATARQQAEQYQQQKSRVREQRKRIEQLEAVLNRISCSHSCDEFTLTRGQRSLTAAQGAVPSECRKMSVMI